MNRLTSHFCEHS